MNDQRQSPHNEELIGNEKKLRKREQRVRDRLQEAQLAQANALERLRRAEARFQKRAMRVQRLEGRLNLIDQQLRALNAPPSTVVTLITSVAESSISEVEEPHSPEKTKTPLAANAPALQSAEHDLSEDAVSRQSAEVEIPTEMMAGEAEQQFLDRFSAAEAIESPSTKEEVSAEESSSASDFEAVVMRAREARAVAEAAEEAARIAIEQATDVAIYLEQVGSARHLMRELELMEAEANNAIALAREAENAALAAERLAAEAGGLAQDKEEQVKLAAEEQQIIASVPTEEESLPHAHPTPTEIAQVEEIDEEEEVIETVAAMIIADAAAIAAAEAEALAEASSARTREARAAAQRADQALASVQQAIYAGLLVGEAAAEALKAAERDATHAHAVLADAEAAEERARNTAMNAEAEAEVAEGMAFAAGDHNERDEKLRDEYGSAHPTSANGTAPMTAETGPDNDDDDLELDDENDEDDEEEDDDTLEMPAVHPEQA